MPGDDQKAYDTESAQTTSHQTSARGAATADARN
jgi:hypothetical protein